MTVAAAPRFAFPADVEGYLLEDVGRMLFDYACRVPADGLIVELGSYKGRSTICLAQSGRTVWAVDHFKGESIGDISDGVGRAPRLDDPVHAHADHIAGTYFAAFMANIKQYVGGGNVKPVGIDSHDGPPVNCAVELLFVDAAHDYDSVSADLSAWEPFITPHGVVILDDVNFPGVERAIVDLGQRGWRFVERVATTMALRRL